MSDFNSSSNEVINDTTTAVETNPMASMPEVTTQTSNGTSATDGTTAPQTTQEASEPAVPTTEYASVEAAEAAYTPTGKHKVFAVTKPDESVVYVWALNGDIAIVRVCKLAGYSASLAVRQRAPRMTADAVRAKLAKFSDAELAALGLSRNVPTTNPPVNGWTPPATGSNGTTGETATQQTAPAATGRRSRRSKS